MAKRTPFEYIVEVQFTDGWKRIDYLAKSQKPAEQFVTDYAECFGRDARVVRTTLKFDRANPEGRPERKVVFLARVPKPVSKAA